MTESRSEYYKKRIQNGIDKFVDNMYNEDITPEEIQQSIDDILYVCEKYHMWKKREKRDEE